MNWGAGFSRLWLVVSVLWVAGCGVFAYADWQRTEEKLMAHRATYEMTSPAGHQFRISASESVPVERLVEYVRAQRFAKRAQECAERPGPWCSHPEVVEYPEPRPSFSIAPYVLTAVVPPAALLLFGVLLGWIARGFRPAS